MTDRDCDNCAHHSDGGCSVWECSFAQKDDTISRQAAIDALTEYGNGRTVYIGVEEAVRRIKRLPSAQLDTQWIPCSETIDIPDHEVLCCDKYGEELIGWLSYNDDQWLCESDGEMMYNPVAWREKPEPYREEGEADD